MVAVSATMGADILAVVTFLALLLPMMIFVALLNLIPPLRRNPTIALGVLAADYWRTVRVVRK